MSSYGALWAARLRLLRPGNAVIAAVGVFVGAYLVAPQAGTFVVAGPAALAALLITGFGNALNDIKDVETDRTAHPERPLPAGDLSMGQAQGFAAALLALGLLEAWVAAGLPTLLFAGANALLLLAYEQWFKGAGLPGNLLVGILVASTFAFGALTLDTSWQDWGMVWALAVMALLTTVARELMKDVQDMHADAGRNSLPRQWGRGPSLLLAFFLAQTAVALTVFAWFQAPWNRWWGVALLVADALFVLASTAAFFDVRAGQQGLKLAMIAALVAFLVGPSI